MFKRRHKLPLGHRIVRFVWPAIGWRRSAQYVLHRLGRMPGSVYTIAGGFACGAAMSFTPFVGLHFVFSAILAWIIRTNVIASAVGTAVGNPWTFPFIWAWLYQTGRWLTGATKVQTGPGPDFSDLFGEMLHAMLDFDGQYLLETSAPVFWPMLVSSVPTAFVVWWACYLSLKYAITGYHERRWRRRSDALARKESTP